MSTCVLYVDEAGSSARHHVPLRNGETPLFVLGGMTLPLSEWRDFDRSYLHLKRQFFATEMAATKQVRPEHYEVKGNELAAARNRTSQRRHAFIREVLDLTQRWDTALFAIIVLKNADNPTSPVSLYTAALQQLAQRFSVFLAEHPQYTNGITIMDSRARGPRGVDFQVASSHMSYVFGHETGRQLTNLAEAPLFADSRLTAGLQCADNLMSLVYGTQYHYYLRDLEGAPDYSHLRTYWPRLDAMQFRSRQEHDGYPLYGFRRNDFRSDNPQP
jgi:hypothetical protein